MQALSVPPVAVRHLAQTALREIGLHVARAARAGGLVSPLHLGGRPPGQRPPKIHQSAPHFHDRVLQAHLILGAPGHQIENFPGRLVGPVRTIRQPLSL